MNINAVGMIANGTVIFVADKLCVGFVLNGRISAVTQYLLGVVFAVLAA